MAFQILVNCDERHVLSRSFLLWHRVRVFLGGGFFAPPTPITAPLAKDLYRDLIRFDRLILAETLAAVDMPEHAVRYYFERETLHVGEQLCAAASDFCTAHGSVPGLLELLNSGKDDEEESEGEEDQIRFMPGEIVYISPQFLLSGGKRK
jgi:hypothetical protein